MTQTKQRQQNPNEMAEQLADSIWRLTADWGDFAKSSIGLPLTRSVDGVALQLAMSLGRNSVKDHLGRISSARKGLTPASYWLQRATKRGLLAEEQAERIRAQMLALANRLEEHAQAVVQATNKKIAEQKQQPMKEEAAATQVDSADLGAEMAPAH